MFDFDLGLSGSDCIAIFSGGVFSTGVRCLAVVFVELAGFASGELFDFDFSLSGSDCIAMFSGEVFSTGVGCLEVGVMFVELAGSASG